jgi:hypothetical protein
MRSMSVGPCQLAHGKDFDGGMKKMGAKMKKRIYLYTGAVLAAALILFLLTSNIDELHYAQFNGQGKVFDGDSGVALPGVEVALVLSKWRVTDTNERQTLFERQALMRSDKTFAKNFGLSGTNGLYTVRAGQKYGRRTTPVITYFQKNRHPFEKAWLVFKRAGFKNKVVEVDASGWAPAKSSTAENLIPLPEVKMVYDKSDAGPPYGISFPLLYDIAKDVLQTDCTVVPSITAIIKKNYAWALKLKPKPSGLQIKVSLSATGSSEYNLALAEHCGMGLKQKMTELKLDAFDLQIVSQPLQKSDHDDAMMLEFVPIYK